MLRNKTFNGVLWSAIDNFSAQLINFIIGIILARLLTPEEFGLIGMITVFIAISQILVSSGINDSLIRKKEVSGEFYNTAFLFNAGVSIALYFVLYFSAPLIGAFYGKPELVAIIRLLSFTLILNAFTLVQKARIIKAIKFKALTKVSLASSIVSGVIAIVMAYKGYGVYSLVWKNIIASIVTLIFLSKLTGWLPSIKFSKHAFNEMFGFGSRLMVLSLIDTIYQNMYFLIIGKFYSAASLGQYTRAETFKRLPSNSLTQVIQRVSYPVLAEIQDNKVQLRNAYQRLIKSTMLISIVGMFTLSLMAQELTVLLMGEKWQTAGVYLQILCLSGVFYPLDALNTNILKVMNESGKILRIGIYRKLLAIPLVLIIVFIGIKPFLYGMIVHQAVAFALISRYSKGYIGYGTLEQVKDLIPFVVLTLTVYGVIYFTLNYIAPDISNLWSVIIKSGASVLLIGGYLEVSKNDSYMYMKSLILKRL